LSPSFVPIFWEDDDTGADKDAESLGTVFTDSFGIIATMCKIKAADKTPAWTLAERIQNLIAKFHDPKTPGHSPFIFAYIGHGDIDAGELFMSSAFGKSVRWATVQEALFGKSDSLSHIDALGFLDCCYAGGARRGGVKRAIQILAVADKHQTARSRVGGITFSRKSLDTKGNCSSPFSELQGASWVPNINITDDLMRGTFEVFNDS
jgi:hypothetical protein